MATTSKAREAEKRRDIYDEAQREEFHFKTGEELDTYYKELFDAFARLDADLLGNLATV